MFTVIRRRLTFLFAMAAAVVVVWCCGCSDNGIGGAFYEQKMANIERDDISRYKTVTIGGRTWTARNLDIETGNSWCYENSKSSCDKYGRLYDWATAMRICPVGWHLPTHQDWDALVEAAGGSSVAGKMLKAKSGWGSYESYNGTDDFDFSALPGGYRHSGGSFGSAGNFGNWWAATEYGADYAYTRDMRYYDDGVYEGVDYKSYAFSARCVEDERQ